MPRVYRVMQEENGKPKLGSSATTLGVRVPGDIEPDGNGNVHPGTGGMSVSPSLSALPAILVPKRLKDQVPAARGSDGHRVWSLGEGVFVAAPVAPGLVLRPDPHDRRHGFVEPGIIMPLESYREVIDDTRDSWKNEG